MKTLSQEQQTAVDANAPVIYVAAAPGAGKSRTLVARVLRLISDGTDPSRICCLTYTQNGAKVMQERLPGIRLGFVGTLHAYLLRLLQRHGDLIGLPASIVVMDEEEAASKLEQCAVALKVKASEKELQEFLTAVRNNPRPTHPSKIELVILEYLSLMKQTGEFDFDAVLQSGLSLLKRHAAEVCNFEHVLVDEVQDSAALDWQVYETMTGSKCYFGDSDQSIFAFRGANPEEFVYRATNSTGLLLSLSTNYRSGSNIISASQRLIARNEDRIDLEVQPRPDAPAGTVAVYEHANPNEELVNIAKLVSETQKEPGTSLAILFRNNREADQCRAYLQGLGIKLAQPKRVKAPGPVERLGKATLQVLMNPWNDQAMLRYLAFRYGDTVALKMKTTSAHALCSVKQSVVNAKLAFPQVMDKDLLFTRDEWALLLGPMILPETREWLVKLSECVPEPFALSDLLLAAVQPEEEAVAQDGVYCGTFHSAKGGEWDVVHLAGCEQELFPGCDPEEEGRRLFYVGMTRARTALSLSYCTSRPCAWAAWKTETRTRSQFLNELLPTT